MYELINPLDTTGVTLDRSDRYLLGRHRREQLRGPDRTGATVVRRVRHVSQRRRVLRRRDAPDRTASRAALLQVHPDRAAQPDRERPDHQSRSLAAASPARSTGCASVCAAAARAMTTGRAPSTGSGRGCRFRPRPTRTCAPGRRVEAHRLLPPRGLRHRPGGQGQGHWCASAEPTTGNENEDQLYGEVVCVSDGSFNDSAHNGATPEVQLFVMGNPELAMMDNVAYQPGPRQLDLPRGRRNDLPAAAQQRPVGLPAGRHGRRPAVRWVRPHRHVERPDRGVDRRHFRRHRQALLRQRAAQHLGHGHDPRHHRLGVARQAA